MHSLWTTNIKEYIFFNRNNLFCLITCTYIKFLNYQKKNIFMSSVSDRLHFDPDPRIHFLKSGSNRKNRTNSYFFCKRYKTHKLIRIKVPWSGTGSGQMIRIRQDPSPLRRGGGQNPCKLKKMQVFLCGGKNAWHFLKFLVSKN